MKKPTKADPPPPAVELVAPRDTPVRFIPLDRVPLYYDGSRGPLQVTLRNPLQALSLPEPCIRMVPAPDAQDLLSPAIGGGAFSRAIPLAEAEAWRPAGLAAQLEGLAAAGDVTVAEYQPPGAAEPQRFLVLDIKTRRQLRRLSKEVA